MTLRYGYALHSAYFWPPMAAKYAACRGPSLPFGCGYWAPEEYSWNYNRLVECI